MSYFDIFLTKVEAGRWVGAEGSRRAEEFDDGKRDSLLRGISSIRPVGTGGIVTI
jgi:hypothetical protein